MVKRIKHSLEYLIDKSLRNKASEKEENLLTDFALNEYQESKWDEDLMGNSQEVSQNIYEGIQFRIGKENLQTVLKIYSCCQYSFSCWFRIFL